MLRWLVGLFHMLVAAAVVVDGAWLYTQAVLNLKWELGFYGDPSAGTIVMTIASLLALLIAGIEGIIGIGFASRQKWAAHGIVAISALFLFITPPPVNALMAIAATVGMMELIGQTTAPVPDE